MRQIVIIPLYHLSTMYNREKIFNPLNDFLDLPTLFQLCFNPQEYGTKSDIWNKIEATRSTQIFESVKQSGRSVDEMFDDDESFLYEILDVMIDMFIEISYNLVSVYFDVGQQSDYIRNIKISNDSAYILIEK